MLMAPTRPDRPRLRSRIAALGVAAAVALVLHGLVLGGAQPAVPPAPHAVEAVTVRMLEPPAPVVRAVAVAPAAEPVPPARPRPRPRPRVLPEEAPVAADTTAVDAEAVRPVAAPASPASAPDFPLYRVVPPPPARLHYEMKRNMFSGNGDLIWKPAGDGYELRLEATVAGLAVLTEVSTGTLGANGLAPLRYTDQRLRRGMNAANFQRDTGKITYSGPQVEIPLPPGAQDRLSWMLQLGSVLNADPQLAAPGGRVVFFVSGARGDADAWIFRYVGAESVNAAGGAIRAVKFTREPRQTYDRLVEIWLAPSRQHLPVRARFTAVADGEVFELLLRDIQAP